MAKHTIKEMQVLLDYLPKECGRSWARDAIEKEGVPEEYREVMENIASGVFVFAWGVCKSFYSISDGNLSYDGEDKLTLF